jgi:prepilin-type processing-associated H-X9-DG protein
MNCYMNGSGIWQSSNYVTFRKYEDITNPSEKWVLIDERDDSINDGYFAVDMTKKYSIIDVPANFHNDGGTLSFADGHAERRVWLEGTTRPPHSNGGHLTGLPIPTSATDRDLKWLTARTTDPK